MSLDVEYALFDCKVTLVRKGPSASKSDLDQNEVEISVRCRKSLDGNRFNTLFDDQLQTLGLPDGYQELTLEENLVAKTIVKPQDQDSSLLFLTCPTDDRPHQWRQGEEPSCLKLFRSGRYECGTLTLTSVQPTPGKGNSKDVWLRFRVKASVVTSSKKPFEKGMILAGCYLACLSPSFRGEVVPQKEGSWYGVWMKKIINKV